MKRRWFAALFSAAKSIMGNKFEAKDEVNDPSSYKIRLV